MILQKWENNGTEEIGLVTPTPGLTLSVSFDGGHVGRWETAVIHFRWPIVVMSLIREFGGLNFRIPFREIFGSRFRPPKHHIALSKLLVGSHNLEILRGRYTLPVLMPDKRLCPVFSVA